MEVVKFVNFLLVNGFQTAVSILFKEKTEQLQWMKEKKNKRRQMIIAVNVLNCIIWIIWLWTKYLWI